MKKLVVLVFLACCSCKTSFDASSKECVEKDQEKDLIEAVELFETKIQKKYPNSSLESAYFKFLSDWANKELKVDFFKDSLELKIRELDIWTASARSSENMEREKGLFNVDSMNPVRVKLNLAFSKCLANKIEYGIGTSTFLRMNSKLRISPKQAIKSLYKTSETDLRKFENRLTIVLGVYYQTMFNVKITNVNYSNESLQEDSR